MRNVPLILVVMTFLSGTAAFGQLDWVPVNPGVAAPLQSVYWAHDRLIAVNGRDSVATSPDGFNWTLSKTNCWLRSATWGDGKYVAVGYRDYASRTQHKITGIVCSSPDGNNWKVLQETPHGYSWYLNDIIWSDTQFVAVGEPSIILTSPDGYNWTARTPVPNIVGYYTSVVWTGSQYVAVGLDQGIGIDLSAVLTSPDGVAWETRKTVGKTELTDVVWTGKLLVAIGKNGLILTSQDGIAWTLRDSGTKLWLTSIVWTGHELVAIGNVDTAVVLSSPDGITWTDRTPPRFYVQSLAWTGQKLVAVGTNGNILISSEDPISLYPHFSLNTDIKLSVGNGEIRYTLPEAAPARPASASIYSLSGKLIVSGTTAPGREGRIPVHPLATGVYLFKLKADGKSFSRFFEIMR